MELTGAKTYIGAGDVDMVRGVNELQWASQFGMPFEEPFELDVIIHDGDVINIGDREFLFREIPGHTAGTLAIFFNAVDGGKTFSISRKQKSFYRNGIVALVLRKTQSRGY